MSVSCECCVLSVKCLCDGLIHGPGILPAVVSLCGSRILKNQAALSRDRLLCLTGNMLMGSDTECHIYETHRNTKAPYIISTCGNTFTSLPMRGRKSHRWNKEKM